MINSRSDIKKCAQTSRAVFQVANAQFILDTYFSLAL